MYCVASEASESQCRSCRFWLGDPTPAWMTDQPVMKAIKAYNDGEYGFCIHARSPHQMNFQGHVYEGKAGRETTAASACDGHEYPRREAT